MKRAVLGLGMVGLSVLGVACSGGTEAPPPFEAGAQALAARLEAATGVQWQVAVGAKGAEALVPAAPVRLSPGSADEQAKAFVRAYGKDLHLGSAGVTVEPRAAAADGVDYVRLAQTLPGTEIVVFDAVTTMSFDAEGRVEAILPSFSEGTEGLGTTPTLSAAAAQEVAKQVWSKTCEGPVKEVVASEPVLGAATNAGGLRLAYRLQVGGLETDCAAAQFDIDAATGSVLAVSGTRGAEDIAGGVRFARGLDPNDKKKLIVTGALGVNTMVSPSVPIVTCSSYGGLGVALTSSSPGQWDDGKGAAVDGYFYAMEALRFFREGLGRNGLDDRGLGVRIVVHDNSAANDFGRNACFRNTGKGLFLPLGFLGGAVVLPEVHIGDGNAERLPYSASYDLLAHELGHGIVAYSSKLLYQGESGAIDESFADVVGVSAREWSRLPGQPVSLRLGEKFVIGGMGAVRNMEEPGEFLDPDHVSRMFRCDSGEAPSKKNDMCWVHVNSGIGNKAFALMVKGGKHMRYGIPKATSWESARKIWYRAVSHLPPKATYLQAAEAQVNEARRFGTDAFLATACAWIAVGVLPEGRIVGGKQVCQEPLELGKSTPPRGCAGIEEGYACHESAPYAAYVCRKGAIAGGINCKSTSQRCRPLSPTDHRATVGTNGELVCDEP